MRVQRKKAVSPATMAPAISAATRSKVEMKTPATSNGMLEMPRSSRCTWVPQRSCAAPSMIQERPSVAMNSVIGERLTSGLQHRALDAEAEQRHRRQRRRQRGREGEAVLDQADEGQRREEHHRALREVQHARGLVDQHEADRDQRVHHAGEQAADQHLDQEEEVVPVHQAASAPI